MMYDIRVRNGHAGRATQAGESETGLLLARARGRRGGAAGRLLEAVRAAELLAEPLHAAGGVDEFLLAREERVAIAANVDVDLRQRAARRERVATCAVNATGLVTGVDLGLHGDELLDRARA